MHAACFIRSFVLPVSVDFDPAKEAGMYELCRSWVLNDPHQVPNPPEDASCIDREVG